LRGRLRKWTINLAARIEIEIEMRAKKSKINLGYPQASEQGI
jgi:hypothetical protein